MVATLHIKGDTDGAVKAAGKAAAAVGDVRAKFKEATKEAEKYERAAKKIFEDNLTPMGKYHRKMAELTHLLMQQKISTEHYRAEVKKLDDAMSGASDEAARLASLAKRISEDNITPLAKYNKGMADLKHLYTQNQISSAAYHAEAKKLKSTLDITKVDKDKLTIPESAISSVVRYSLGFFSLASAANFAKSAIMSAVEERRKAAEAQEQSGASIGSTLLITNSKEEFEHVQKMSERIASSGAAGSVGDNNTMPKAIAISNAIHESELDKDLATWIEMGKKKLITADAMPDYIGGVGSIIKIFKDQLTSVGDQSAEVNSMIIEANAKGKAKPELLSFGVAKTGELLKQLNTPLEQGLAMLTVGAARLPDRMPIERLEAFGNFLNVNRDKFGQGSMLDRARNIEDQIKTRGLTTTDIFQKDSMAEAGFVLLKEYGREIEAASKNIGMAKSGDMLRNKFALGDSITSLKANEIKDASEGSKEVLRQEIGNRELVRQARESDIDLYQEQILGYGSVRRFANRSFRGAFNFFDDYILDRKEDNNDASSGFIIHELMKQTKAGNKTAVGILERILQASNMTAESSAKIANPQTRPSVPKPEQ